MDSLEWVDQTYIQKHKSEDPKTLRAMYYPNLRMYTTHGDTSKHRAPKDAAIAFLVRFGRRAGISLVIYLLSYLPVVGRFVLPAASFYTFNNAVGPVPAAVIFGSGIFLPRRYLVVFLQSYFSSRSLMRELVSRRIAIYSRLGWTDLGSLNLTFHVYASQKSKSAIGSVTARVCCLGLVWDSTFFSRSLYWAYSSTALPKHQPRFSSLRSQILHHLLPTVKSFWKARSSGRTSMSFSSFLWRIWMPTISRQMERGRILYIIQKFQKRSSPSGSSNFRMFAQVYRICT